MPVDTTRTIPTRRTQRKMTEEEMKEIEMKRIRGKYSLLSTLMRVLIYVFQVNSRVRSVDD